MAKSVTYKGIDIKLDIDDAGQCYTFTFKDPKDGEVKTECGYTFSSYEIYILDRFYNYDPVGDSIINHD